METKALPFQLSELKASGDGWEVEGYASTFGGAPDRGGDVVVKGAFLRSLGQYPNVPLVWQHDQKEPIGLLKGPLVEDEKGLYGRWSLVDTDMGTKAHKLLSKGLINSFSIGYLANDTEWKEDIRLLKDVELVEVSLVTVPMNPSALVTGFKSDVPFDTLLKQAIDAIALAHREAKALGERREATGRSLNDRHIAAIEELLPEAKALVAELDALRVVPKNAEADAAEMDLLRMRARLLRARRRTA